MNNNTIYSDNRAIKMKTTVLDKRTGADLYRLLLSCLNDAVGSCKQAKEHLAKYEEDLLHFMTRGYDDIVLSQLQRAIHHVQEEITILTFKIGMLGKMAIKGKLNTQKSLARLGALDRETT